MSRVYVALDMRSAEEAVRMARPLAEEVAGFKVGLELLMGPGPGVVTAIGALGRPVFADAKLHDIPNTVRGAARQLGALGARWVTAHSSGGADMLHAAVEGLADGASGNESGILAITVLTSLGEAELAAIGVGRSVGAQVARMSRLAAGSGVAGLVCAVRELGDVAQTAPGLVRVVPGVRPTGHDPDDQQRVATPEEAVRRGADYVVVGRPITRAADPLAALRAINTTIDTP